jgi:hypothetical protein
MLVTLTSGSSGKIIMFDDVAHRLFAIIGKECTARGVFTKEQLPDAIAKLQRALADEKNSPDPNHSNNSNHSPEDKEDDEEDRSLPVIGLAQRAHPFIEMMELTRKDDGFVMWHADHSF